MTLAPASNSVGVLVRGLLDKGYQQAAQATLDAISQSVTSGIVAQRLTELEAEAARLDAAGERLQPDNPVLRALLADLEPQLGRDAARVDLGAANAQQVGVDAAAKLTRELALPGMTDARLAVIGVRWNVPDPQAVNALVGYVHSPAWAQQMAGYPPGVLDIVQRQAIAGMVNGWGAGRTASAIRLMTQSVPLTQANTLMRTVQLQSYRDATAIHQQANADILTGQIRIATLDDATCLCCIALHGTEMEVGETVEGHYNCRCTSIAVVRGNPRDVQGGEDWFDGLPEDRQRAIAGDSAFEALTSGGATLRDFVQPLQDKVFGQMLTEASVKGVLARRG